MNKNFKINHNIIPLDETEESQLSMFDMDNPDINLLNAIDDEVIRISGSKIEYYMFLRDESSYDEVYLEQRNKPRMSEPKIVWAHYDPKVLEQELGQFGVELSNDIPIIFNKHYIEKSLGRSPIAGDVLKPKFQNIRFEVVEVQEDSFEIYGVYHYTCTCKLLRDNIDSIPEVITKVSKDVGGIEEILDDDNI